MEELIAFLGIFILVLVALLVVMLVSNWRLYQKAGVEGWKSLIPFYSTYVTNQIAFNNTKNQLGIIMIALSVVGNLLPESGLTSILSLVSLAGTSYIYYNFMKRFGSTGFAIASLFAPFICMPIAAFSSSFVYTPYEG